MATPLQAFREQYPQYNDWSDEDLAESLRRKYYADWDPAEYRKQLGLPPIAPEAPPEPPSIIDRVASFFQSETDTPQTALNDTPDTDLVESLATPDALEKDTPEPPDKADYLGQLVAGWNQYLANRDLGQSIDLIEAAGDVEAVAAGQKDARETGGPLGISAGQIARQTRQIRAQAGDEAAARAIDEEIASERARLTKALQENIDEWRARNEKAQAVPFSAPTRKMLDAATLEEGWAALREDPIMIMAEISLRSLPNMVEGLGLAALGSLAGPGGFAAGMGAGSALTEYRASFAEGLQKFGNVDLGDAASLIRASEDKALMQKVNEYAMTRAGIIGAADWAGAGIATKNLTPFIKNMLGRELSNAAVQTAVQAGLGAGGEAGAQIATGQKLQAGEIMAEAVGGAATAVFDVGGATVTGVRAEALRAKAARAEAEIDEIMGNDKDPEPGAGEVKPDVPRETPEVDPRLKRKPYRDTLLDRALSLTPQLEKSERPAPPEWFSAVQDDPKARMTPRQAIHAVEKALSGKELGVREQRLITTLLDQITLERTRQVPRAREARDQARQDRRPEPAYDPAQTNESRQLLDTMEDARAQGVPQKEIETTVKDAPDPVTARRNLEEKIHARPEPARAQAVQAPEQQEEGRSPGTTPETPAIRAAGPPGSGPIPDIEADYTDSLTGVANAEAYALEADLYDAEARVDISDMKFINQRISEDAGDAVIKAVASALDQADVSVYRIEGDKFAVLGDSKDQVEAAVNLARGILANQEVSSIRGRKRGIGLSAGIVASKGMPQARARAAQAALRSDKVQRRREGKRAGSPVEMPPGVTFSLASAKPLNMEPGTNYVPLIGQTGALPIDPDFNYVLGNGRKVRIPKDPVRREHILAVMQKYFGRRIYQGRVRGRLTLGFYRPGHGEIRLKNHGDVEVAAHELAHYLDDRYPWISQLYARFADEAKSVSYNVDQVHEGWAEFARLFFTQDHEASKRAPGLYDAWLKALGEHEKLGRMVFDLQELMHAWVFQGARARLAGREGSDVSLFDRIRRHFSVSPFQQALDGLRRIRTVEELVSDEGAQAYEKLRLALGGHFGVTEAVVEWGTVGFRADGKGLEFTGEGLKQIFGKYYGNRDLAHYMMARRGHELMQQGREKNLREDEIMAGLALATEENKFAEMFDRYQDFNKRMMDFAQAAGLIGPAQRAAIEEMNKNYVPFYRVLESFVDGKPPRPGGNPYARRLVGSSRNVNNIWDNIVNNVAMTVRAALINDGKRTLLKKLSQTDKLGAGQQTQAAALFASPIPMDIKPVRVPTEQILSKAVKAMGWDMASYRMAREGMAKNDEELAMVAMIDQMVLGLGDMVTFFQPAPPTGNVDFYMEDGQKKWFEINDPGLWDALKFLGPKSMNLVLGIMGAFSATLRRGVVAVPVFQIKNFMRDTTNAWLMSRNVRLPAARAMRVVFSRMNKDPDYWLMVANGGGFASRSQGLEAQRRIIVNPTRLTSIYDRFMSRFENANRLAEFKAAMARGESPRRAAFLSREISTDFAMRGSSDVARFLAISVPFLNARVQGLYRIKHQLDNWPLALSYALRGSLLMMGTLALYALNKDDERYKEMAEDIKDLYWVFFTGPGEDDYFLIPKPFESGMLFGTIPERMFEYIEQRDGKELADALLWMFLETFNMDMTPQTFQPWIDLENNRDFRGAPIVPFYLQGVEPQDQYKYYTSVTVRELSKVTGWSPLKTEHVLRGYLGTLGGYAIAASDAMVRAVTDVELEYGEPPSRGETWRENILVKALIDPLVNEGPPRRTKPLTDFYEMVKEAEKVSRTVALRQERFQKNVESYLQENDTLYATHPFLARTRDELRGYTEKMNLIRMDGTMTPDEKRLEIWNLTRERNLLVSEAMREIRAAQADSEREQEDARVQ